MSAAGNITAAGNRHPILMSLGASSPGTGAMKSAVGRMVQGQVSITLMSSQGITLYDSDKLTAK